MYLIVLNCVVIILFVIVYKYIVMKILLVSKVIVIVYFVIFGNEFCLSLEFRCSFFGEWNDVFYWLKWNYVRI